MGRDLAERFAAAAARLRRGRSQLLGWSVSQARLGGPGGTAERHAADAAVPGHHLAGLPGGPSGRLAPSRPGAGAGLRGRPLGRRVRRAGRGRRPLVRRRACAWSRGAAQLMAAAQVDGGMAAVIGLDREAVADAIAGCDSLAGGPGGGQRQRAGPGRHLRHAATPCCGANDALKAAGARRRDPAAGLGAVPLAPGWRTSATSWPRHSSRRHGGRAIRRWSATSPPSRSATLAHPRPAGRAGALTGGMGRIGPAHGRRGRRHVHRMRARAAR